jgi:hypothetical protein
MVLAILESDVYSHPPIEAVFTTDEEVGMLGAMALDTSVLKGSRMINIDSEEDDVVTVSCAGGSDFSVVLPLERVKKVGTRIDVTLKGLQGGHSGVEINSGRINSNILAGRFLNYMRDVADFDIISVNGGALGGIGIPSALVKPLDNIPFKLIMLLSYAALCIFVFNFTKIGRRLKFLGGNPNCAKLSGIRADRYAIVAFVMAGIGVGLGAFLTLVYTPSVTATTAGGIGMNVIVAIVFGGMPISGGPRSRIYSALMGGFSYILLNNILKMLISGNAGYGISQIVSAVFFLAVVYITGMNYRTKLLAR